ncbi:cytochrome P450 [Nocardiopsis gilva YIM 90087]|uniref:Cytochrome P450 n=1 Tax=Nocardiopsis gilva YIM 90087 TaxID=1235441 RepID=A0A223SBZ4_9ACTN|nr:cytochrome P450 [Nocardiopsis gilva]ASU85583.1 cytochrome P450 [Nocardiopsis gilva YIM 90087]
MTSDIADTIPAYPPPRTCPLRPSPEFDRLRAERPISRMAMRGGGEAWVVTRYEDVRTLLADPRMSSDRAHPGFPRLIAGLEDIQPREEEKPPIVNLDGAEHSKARGAILSEFTVRRVREMRPWVQGIVDRRVDAMLAAGPPVDLVDMLSLPVPLLVVCGLLGASYSDNELFEDSTRRMMSAGVSDEDRFAAAEDLSVYLERLCREKEADPTEDDLLGRQVLRYRREEGEVDHAELVALALMLLVAGHETTANVISMGVASLLEHPDQLAKMRADPGLLPATVEEVLRFCSVTDAITARVATADIEIGGVLIRAGEGVIAHVPSANHDPSVFARPERLDIDRGARHHFGFGYGPHQCAGQNLARLELQITIETLFRRIPNLRIDAPLDSLPYKDNSMVYGLYELPVRW